MRNLLTVAAALASGCDECVKLGDVPGCRPVEECVQYEDRWFVVEGPGGIEKFDCVATDQCRVAYNDAIDAACRSN